MLKQLFEFKETDRQWHLPVLAGLCVGINPAYPVQAQVSAGPGLAHITVLCVMVSATGMFSCLLPTMRRLSELKVK